MKNRFIGDLADGERVSDIFLVKNISTGKTRTNTDFMRLALFDKSGTIQAVKWDASQTELSTITADKFVLLTGTVSTYQNELQIKAEQVKLYEGEVKTKDFVEAAAQDVEEMFSAFAKLIADVRNPRLQALLGAFFATEPMVDKFREAPAARKNHHARNGGLLEHTLKVTEICRAVGSLYPDIDMDILITGAALHDIGKVEEYSWEPAINFTDYGHLVGHVAGGAVMIQEAAEKIEGFDRTTLLALQHMVLSHHGKMEYGSPKEPKSIEALILHAADNLDCYVDMFAKAIGDEKGQEGLFTAYNSLVGGVVFKGYSEDQSTNGHSETDIDSDPFID